MAIFYMRTSILRKAAGKSCVASSAYQSGEKLYSALNGKSYFYTGKEEIKATGVAIPDYANKELANREYLWSLVERTHKNRLARNFICAMPSELSDEQNIEIAKEFVEKLVERGMCVDWAYHSRSMGNKLNKHLHLMTTLRLLDPEKKDTFLPMDKKEYVLENGEKVPEIDPETNEQKYRIRKKNGKEYKELIWKRRTVQVNEWNKRETLNEIKKEWAEICNKYLAPENQIDYRSYKEQNKNRVPMVHEGPNARAALQRGIKFESVIENEHRRKLNKELERLEKFLQDAKRFLEELKERLKKRGVRYEKGRCDKRDNDIGGTRTISDGISEVAARDDECNRRTEQLNRIKDEAERLKKKSKRRR